MVTLNVFSWWICLCAVGTFNVAAWTVSAIALRRRPALTAETLRLRRLQMILSAIYVAGCAFRSAVPVYDVPRICLFDQWFASVLVGRSVATIAELCFVAQWALMLHEVARRTENAVGRLTSVALLPLIAVAETCSWYSVLTTSNLGHVVEESLWGCCVALMVASALTLAPRCTARWRAILFAWCLVGMVYVAFMVAVDVPMYWARWLTDEAAGRQYMTLAQGFMDIASRRVVSYRWADWRHEIAWMSLYFSVAVWISISLIHVPEMQPLQVLRERKLRLAPRGLTLTGVAKRRV